MVDILEQLRREVDIQLSDKRNEVLDNLLSSKLRFGNCIVTFKCLQDALYDGIANIASPEGADVRLLLQVYILADEIFVSLFTLDLVKLVDVPSAIIIAELQALVAS
jgi:hypothetical protein